MPRIGRAPAPMEADYTGQIAAGRVHVAVDGTDRVLGFVVFYPVAEHMLLENVAVRPDEAGRGHGRALIAFCEAAARAAGFGAVRLYTNARMAENLAFYPRLGYREIARRREDGFDRVWFEKRLG